MAINQECPVCRTPAAPGATLLNVTGSAYRVRCHRCSEYRIEHIAARVLATTDHSPIQRANAAGWIRANADDDLLIRQSDLEWLMHLQTPTIGEKAVKLLRYLTKLNPAGGQTFIIPRTVDILAVC